MIRPEDVRRAAIASESAALLEYRAMPETQILLALLDVLAEDGYAELATVTPGQLGFRQGALAQLNALRGMIRSGRADRSARV